MPAPTTAMQQLEGKVSVSVIGAQRQGGDDKHGYTGYRTVVVYRGECFERVVRYSEFRAFYRRLRTRDGKKAVAKFPAKRWSRKTSMLPEVIEERRVLLNDFMKKVCAMELAPPSEDALLRLLRFGKHEDASRASDSMFSRSIRSDLPSELLDAHAVARKESVPLTAHEEVDENALSRGESEDAVNFKREVVDCLTLTDVDVAVPSNTSSVGTVMTMDELLAVDEGVASPAEASDAPARTLTKSVSQELPTTTSSMLLTERPALRTSQSLSMRRQKKVVAFAPKEGAAPSDPASTDPVDEEPHDDEDSSAPRSPSDKYLRSINLHMSMIHETLYGKDDADSNSTDARPPIPST